MDSLFKYKNIKRIITVNWFLMIYIVAALTLWFILLYKQNEQIYQFRIQHVGKELDQGNLAQINKEYFLKKVQFISEGLVFLAVSLFLAWFVNRTAKNQIGLNRNQKNFMMAITHELKTPISIIKLNSETLLKRTLSREQMETLFNRTVSEANRLDVLVSNILIVSQLESGSINEKMEPVNLTDLSNNCIDEFKKRFPEKTVISNIDKNLTINGDSMLIYLLIVNLLDNANKYSPRQTPVYLEVNRKAGSLNIVVKDEGQGVPNGEKQKIFERFYRSQNEMSRKTKGVGLGLFLCSEIVRYHHGKIQVYDNSPTGAIFKVNL